MVDKIRGFNLKTEEVLLHLLKIKHEDPTCFSEDMQLIVDAHLPGGEQPFMNSDDAEKEVTSVRSAMASDDQAKKIKDAYAKVGKSVYKKKTVTEMLDSLSYQKQGLCGEHRINIKDFAVIKATHSIDLGTTLQETQPVQGQDQVEGLQCTEYILVRESDAIIFKKKCPEGIEVDYHIVDTDDEENETKNSKRESKQSRGKKRKMQNEDQSKEDK